MKKIAIVRRNGLGDLLCTVPLIKFIKKNNPEAKITLFVEKRNSPLLPYLSGIDEAVVLPSLGNKYWNLFKVGYKYKNHFDIAISAKTSSMKLMNFFLYFLRAKEKIAYVDKSWHSFLINVPRTLDGMPKHQALKALNLVDPDLESIDPSLFPAISIPEIILKRYAIDQSNKDPCLLISASTTLEKNRLSPKKYADLLNALYKTKSIFVRIIAESKDKDRAEEIAALLKMPHSLHFPRNFDEFMLLLSLNDLYFVGDGGVAHLGAALNKKVVVLFGSSDPKLWAPLGKEVSYFYHPKHVDLLSEDEIFETLSRKLIEVEGARNNL